LRDYICSRDVGGFGECGKTRSENKILVKNLIVDWRIVLKCNVLQGTKKLAFRACPTCGMFLQLGDGQGTFL